ncbi:MAG: Uncharacterised protein [Marine Group II euryarchaeote MED-G33]|nr:MAG: Uncharacterised protein [Marine Group II euryarchaeote MED-G33]
MIHLAMNPERGLPQADNQLALYEGTLRGVGPLPKMPHHQTHEHLRELSVHAKYRVMHDGIEAYLGD